MISGAVSEAVLVNIGNPRYFQHGGNLMVKIILFFFHEGKSPTVQSLWSSVMTELPAKVNYEISTMMMSTLVMAGISSRKTIIYFFR
jgi:hypothetical protein